MTTSSVRNGSAAAAAMAAVLVLVLLAIDRADGWETWNDYGRWYVSEDRRAIVTDRPARTCNSPVRVDVRTERNGDIEIAFEQRVVMDGFCTLGGCMSSGGPPFHCGETIPLDEPLPAGAPLRSICDSQADHIASVPRQSSVNSTITCSDRPVAFP